MKYTNEYSWYASYLDTDMLWLEDVINWDDVFEIAGSEYNMLGLLTTAFFLNPHHFLDWMIKLSYLDLFFDWEIDTNSLLEALFSDSTADEALALNSIFFSLPTLFYADFQDLLVTIGYYSPELVLAARDYVAVQWIVAAFDQLPAATFDVYQDSTSMTTSEFLEHLTSFCAFAVYVVYLIGIARLTGLADAVDAYVTRAYYYLYSLSLEVRFQFEATLQVFFFIFLYTSMMMATFDDDQEELLEFLNTMCFYLFLFTMAFYLVKYSIHYFSFLEAAKGETRAVSLLTQFVFDALNAFAFVIRFLVLMLRLNIYDSVDDILDSYYIFMADFEEEEYFSDALVTICSVLAFDSDVNDDRSFLFEDEVDFASDLFSIYFIVWGKFAYFWMFILEEIARVALALYVTYLLIFEINAVNRSYIEDQFLVAKHVEAARLREANRPY